MAKMKHMRMRALICTAVCAAMAAGTAATAQAESGAAIEVAYNLTTDDFSIFEQIVKDFTEETGIQVTIYNGGGDYEAAMKTRMSSGDLPDMWTTHGWSLIRYSEYMMDLSDQAWVANIDPGMKDVITNDDGELFILPITQAVCAILYNQEVLDEAGIDPAQIRTWADFDAACQAVKDNTEATPIMMELGDAFDSYSLEVIWPTLYTNSDLADNKAAALKDGSFDWETQGREGFEMLADWYAKGYMNEDYVSCKIDDIRRAFANKEGAFALYSTETIPSILAYNENAKMGIIPAPSKDENGASNFEAGEGNFSCFGVWKDTEYPDECRKFLDYLARPEVAVKIVEIDGGIPSLTNIELDENAKSAYTTNAFRKAQEQFEGDVLYDNFFDREYLPSGMWSVMADSVGILLADGDPEGTMDEAITMVADNYKDLMGN